jgi:DeoR family fructose operon transcriptional repressor
MYPAERQDFIVVLGREHGGVVVVAELSLRLGVATETIRRDLALLERRGILRRHHGGAALIERAPFELPLQRRNDSESVERHAIATLIVEQLPEDTVVMLDSGSMTLEIAKQLPDDRRLMIVTNSLPIAAVLARRPNLSVLTLPGRLRAVTQATVGDWAHRRLRELRSDIAVIGANGVGIDSGVTTTLPEEVEIKRGMMRSARRRMLAVTASKFTTDSLCRVAQLDEFDLVATDDRLDADTVDALNLAGPELLVASTRTRQATPPATTHQKGQS